MFLETREGRRAEARTNPAARDYMRSTTGWRVVSTRAGRHALGRLGDNGGMVGHRGALHPGEYVDAATLRPMVERELGFTYQQVHSVYSTGGRIPSSRQELRAAVDARLLALSVAGANMDLLGRAVGINPSTLDRALARARACGPDIACASFVRSSDNGPARLEPPGPDQRGVISMAAQTVTTLDPKAVADGIGELKVSGGSARIAVGGTTVMYVKKSRVAVRAAHVKRIPKKLGTPVPEANGIWVNIAAESTEKARAILEYVVART